jgi:hypothetical protein
MHLRQRVPLLRRPLPQGGVAHSYAVQVGAPLDTDYEANRIVEVMNDDVALQGQRWIKSKFWHRARLFTLGNSLNIGPAHSRCRGDLTNPGRPPRSGDFSLECVFRRGRDRFHPRAATQKASALQRLSHRSVASNGASCLPRLGRARRYVFQRSTPEAPHSYEPPG